MDDEVTLTAYHEAGHAVIGYALGGAVESLQLGGEADYGLPERFGDCRINWGKVDPSTDWQLQRELLTVLAGPVAELVYRGEPFCMEFFGPWQDDWQRAWEMSRALAADTPRRAQLLGLLMRRLEQLVRGDQLWAAIAAVADELLAHEYLEQEQTEDILAFWIK